MIIESNPSTRIIEILNASLFRFKRSEVGVIRIILKYTIQNKELGKSFPTFGSHICAQISVLSSSHMLTHTPF